MKANTTGRYTTAYDALNRARRVVDPANKTITYAYDPRGLRQFMSDPDSGRFTYSYDAAYRISSLINPQGDRTSYSYDAANRRTLTKLANGARASVTYDTVGNVATLANITSGGAYISRFDYKYDANNQRTGVLEVDSSRVTWLYDAANQLTVENRTGSSAYRQTYTYDAASNRTLKNIDGTRSTYAYDAANQLRYSQDVGGRTTYSFDANGNQQIVTDPALARTTTTWDYENKTKVVAIPSGIRNTMAYEPNGLRVRLDESTGIKKFVYDGQNYLLETNDSGITLATYTNEPLVYGNLISQRRSSATSWYHFDALGSARQLSDSGKNVTDTYLYDAWGNLIASTEITVNPFRWVAIVGYYYDPETGLWQIRARIYLTPIARWTSVDPMPAQIIEPYAYSFNSPYMLIDPTGYEASGVSPTIPHCMFNEQEVTYHFDGRELEARMFTGFTTAVSGSPMKIEGPFGHGRNRQSRYTFDYSAAYQKVKFKGPIPEGAYWLNVCEELSCDIPASFNFDRRHCISQTARGKYSWPLHPFPGTETYGCDGFNLHGGKYWGSAGCVDIGKEDSWFHTQFLQLYKANGCQCCFIDLWVAYDHFELANRPVVVYGEYYNP